jgi:hypothetical protein
MKISIPDHLEVTIRVCLSLILTYTLSLGFFPNAVPPSQSVLIASIASFTIVLPTLLFIIGAFVFPGILTTTIIALILATTLLAIAATAGTPAYIVVYFFFALIISGLRFSKEGNSTAMLLLYMSLFTTSLVAVAEQQGLPFVASLWTQQGITNPNAVFRNTLIGTFWACVCTAFGRLLPPPRTARSLYSRVLLPKVLMDIATFIRLTVAYHNIKDDDMIENNVKSAEGRGEEDPVEDNDAANDNNKKMENIDDVAMRVVQDGSITIGGGLAKLTYFEPRITHVLCQCGQPIDTPTMLKDLTNAVNNSIFAALTLRSFSKAGFKELDQGGLKEVCEESAKILDQCADDLASLKKSGADDNDDGGELLPSDSYHLQLDPVMGQKCALKVKTLVESWNMAMGPVDDRNRRHFDKGARGVIVKSILPWIYGAGIGLLVALMGCVRKALTKTTWKRIFLPPYYDLLKLIWCIKFAVGFTVLLCMQAYWPAFANLEVPTSDQLTSAYFAGWFLIAYGCSTTQTTEGTWKKSFLRIIGTTVGGFSAWLGLTICGENAYGLGAWMTAINTLAVYLFLPKGFPSRFGLDQDNAMGPAYFAMTHALIVMEVYSGAGGKDEITVNRILANLVGICMAMLMSILPGGVYGNSPREAKFLLEDQKRAFRDCLKLVLEESDSDEFHHYHASAKSSFLAGFIEANDNYNDTKMLKRLCILTPNPEMKIGLTTLAIIGSSVLKLIHFGAILVESNPCAETRFNEEDRKIIESILDNLDIEEDIHNTSLYGMHHQKGEGKKHESLDVSQSNLQDDTERVVPVHTTFTHLCIFIAHNVINHEIKLDEIQYGFFNNQKSPQGRRTKLPETIDPLQ